jgi:hypothetical protein
MVGTPSTLRRRLQASGRIAAGVRSLTTSPRTPEVFALIDPEALALLPAFVDSALQMTDSHVPSTAPDGQYRNPRDSHRRVRRC